MRWDDLKFILTIAECGSLGKAARKLGVDASTVYRRLRTIEEVLDTRLFDRRREGYTPTAAGEDMITAAGRAEDEIQAAVRKVTGRTRRLEGRLRVTMPDTCMLGPFPAYLRAFREQYPAIELDLIVGNEFLNLARREADVALRPTNSPEGDMVGRRLVHVAFARYTSAVQDGDSDSQTFVGYDETLRHLAAAKWAARQVDPAKIMMRANLISAQYALVRAGAGESLLPCFVGDGDKTLVRSSGIEEDVTTVLWVFTHHDLRNNARVRAFIDHMVDCTGRDRDLFEAG